MEFRGHRISLILSLFTAALVLGCESKPLTLEVSESSLSRTNVDSFQNEYTAQALAILQQRCASCHTESGGPLGVYGFNNISHLVASRLVVGGQPEQSSLYLAIESGYMPPAGALAADAQSIIYNWIAAAQPSSSDIPTPNPSNVPLSPTYASLQANIFGPKCTSCHSQNQKSGGYAFDNYAGVLSGLNLTAPQRSPIYRMVDSGEMPPRGPLQAGEVDTLLTWIAMGAPQ